MKYTIAFLLIAVSFLSGEILYRSKSFVTREEANPELLDIRPKPTRTLKKIEKLEEQEPQTEQESIEPTEKKQVSLDEFLNVFYLDRKGKIFIHPKSVLDLKVVTSTPQNSQLYYGFEKENLELYEFPIRTFEGVNSIYYSTNKTAEPNEFKVFIDSQVPEITNIEIFGEPYPKSERKIFSGQTEIEIAATDRDSGIKAIRIYDPSGKILAQSEVLFEQEKEFTVRLPLTNIATNGFWIEVEDNVSNITRTDLIEVEIDSNPPTLSLKLEPTPSEIELSNGICPIGTIVSVIAQDKETEVSAIEYRYPNQEWRTYKSRLILAKSGDYKIEFRAKDFFGNTSLPIYLECRVVKEQN